MLDIVTNYHGNQFHEKLMNQAQQNGGKPHFWLDLGYFSPNPGQAAKCFFLNLPPSVTRHHSQVSSCMILEKSHDQILQKCSDRWTERQTDRRIYRLTRAPSD